MKLNKHQKVFKEVLKNFDEPTGQNSLNLYLTYRGIKKGSWYTLKEKEFNKILKFCKKHKLNCIYQKRNNPEYPSYNDRYDIIISRKKIPANIFDIMHIKNNKYKITNKFNKKIGNILGFPRVCIDYFINEQKREDKKKNKKKNKKKEKKRYSYEIKINFIFKDSKKIQQHRVFYFVCDKICKRQIKNMMKKIYREFNKNLKVCFYHF